MVEAANPFVLTFEAEPLLEAALTMEETPLGLKLTPWEADGVGARTCAALRATRLWGKTVHFELCLHEWVGRLVMLRVNVIHGDPVLSARVGANTVVQRGRDEAGWRTFDLTRRGLPGLDDGKDDDAWPHWNIPQKAVGLFEATLPGGILQRGDWELRDADGNQDSLFEVGSVWGISLVTYTAEVPLGSEIFEEDLSLEDANAWVGELEIF
jgi:hypothetical protein